MGWRIWDSIPGGYEDIFLFFKMCMPPLDPTQFPIKWIPGLLSPLIKRPEREDDDPSPCSAETKNEMI
jgi:hypothetical protein